MILTDLILWWPLVLLSGKLILLCLSNQFRIGDCINAYLRVCKVLRLCLRVILGRHMKIWIILARKLKTTLAFFGFLKLFTSFSLWDYISSCQLLSIYKLILWFMLASALILGQDCIGIMLLINWPLGEVWKGSRILTNLSWYCIIVWLKIYLLDTLVWIDKR